MKSLGLTLTICFSTLLSIAQTGEWSCHMEGGGPEIGHCIAVDDDGNVVTTGYFNGEVDFDPGEGRFILKSNSSNDIFVQKLNSDGKFLWARQLGGNEQEEVHAIGIDDLGCIYIAGYFKGMADFDPGPKEDILSSQEDFFDIFVMKLGPDGKHRWAKQMGGSELDRANDIAIDNLGNIYFTGVFQDRADMNPGSGTAALESYGNTDIFIEKMDTSGYFLWAKHAGGKYEDRGEAIAVDGKGNVYVAGTFTGKVDFDHAQTSTDELHSTGDIDLFVQKLDSDGNHLWLEHIERTGPEEEYCMTVDDDGNVYLTGTFHGTLDFDPTTDHHDNLTSVGGTDVFIKKLNSDGKYQWAKQIGGPKNEEAMSISVDDVGNIYIMGLFQGLVDFNPSPADSVAATSVGENDIFILKLDTDGNFSWAQQLGSDYKEVPYAMCVHASENIYTTGSMEHIIELGKGLAGKGRTDALYQHSVHEAFVIKMVEREYYREEE